MARRSVLLSVLLSLSCCPGPAGAAVGDLLRVAFPVLERVPTSAEVAQVLREMEAARDRDRSSPSSGYDWVPTALCLRTGREVERRAAAGTLERPDLVRAMLVQFHEIFAANARAYRSGASPAPHWRRAFRVSRALAATDLSRLPDRRHAALSQVISTLYAHMLTDLPLALTVLERRLSPPPSPAALAAAFREVEPIFAPVIRDSLASAEITPLTLGRAWPHLPAWVQGLATGEGPSRGLGDLLVGVRRLAWLRFRHLRRRSSLRRSIDELPAFRSVGQFPPPPGGKP